MYRGGTWLSPFNRMVPLPRSFAADAHGCIMVAGLHGRTEYKVVARRSAPVALLRSDRVVGMSIPMLADGLGMLRVKARATHARFAANGLDPSAFPVPVSLP